MELETTHFYEYFLNMDISLISPFKCLKFSMHVNETHFEGIMSQNNDIGLRFYFIGCRWDFAKLKKNQIFDINKS